MKNINSCDWDLIVTVCEQRLDSVKSILAFKPNAKIILVENGGYDILPFLNVIKSVNLDDYDFVLKLHTKSSRNEIINFNGIPFYGAFWRFRLVDSLLYSKDLFKSNLLILSKDDYGMIADSFFYIKLRNFPEDTSILKALKQKLNIKSNLNYFLAGSMFFIRASILKRLTLWDYNANSGGATGSIVTVFHSIERVFTILTDDEGYKIYKVPMFY